MRKRKSARRGGGPGGADISEERLDSQKYSDEADESNYLDVYDGRRVIARIVEQRGGVALLRPSGAGWRQAGMFLSRRQALAALKAEGG